MSASPWKPKRGDPRPPDSYTQTGPHAYCDESELARRREAWQAMMSAPPPDPPKGEAPEAATTEASGTEQSRRGQDDMLIVAPDTHAPALPGPAATQKAMDWALQQDTGKPGPKLVLAILAYHCWALGSARCWPSVRAISTMACMGETAVLANLHRLQELGFIRDTGDRRGRTRQVIVWQLGNGPESDALNGPDSGPLEGKGAGFRGQTVRIPSRNGPDSGHGTPKESEKDSLEGAGAACADGGLAPAAAAALPVGLPAGLDRDLFSLWVKKRGVQEIADLIAHARVLAADGHDLNALCRQAIAQRWRDWPRPGTTQAPRVKKTRKAMPAFPRDTRAPGRDYS